MADRDFFIKYLMNKQAKSPTNPVNLFDMMQGPNIYQFFTQYEMDYLKDIVLYKRNEEKIDSMNMVMSSKGFSRIGGGTNRIIYRCLDDTSFLVKVALDRTGLQDNNLEFRNQNILKPFVTKMFSTSSDGLMATVERCYPITNKDEFNIVSKEIFDIITTIIGEYVMEDIGKGFFRNWVIRPNFGPVLCDYPYLYKIDGSKLFCNKIDMRTGTRCNGPIDYDPAFNYLECTRCGKRYLAVELEDKSEPNKFISTNIGGKYPMKVRITMNDGTVYETGKASRVIAKKETPAIGSGRLKVVITGGEYQDTTVKEKEPIAIIKPEDIEETITLPYTAEVKKEETTPTISKENKEDKQVTFVESETLDELDKAKTIPPIMKSSGGLRVSSGFIRTNNENVGEY